MAAKGGKRVDPLRLVSGLIGTGKVDTVYRDVYLDRARTLLDGILSLDEFRLIDPWHPRGLPRAARDADDPSARELRWSPALAGARRRGHLVEDFPDPGEDDRPAAADLLTTLKLPSRRGLPRTAIERALSEHGPRVVEKEIGLDPRAFRLVCIPPDVHLRLGEAEGWGRQPLWTHLDGYLVLADGRLRALAGGNARFGGLYDLMGLSRDYDSDRVVARLAVVRRERMVAW